MVIITDAQGNIQSPTIPENIYQGSNLANEIVFLSPLPQSNQCAIKFRLPSGEVTTQQFMTPFTSVPSQYGLNAWVYRIPVAITQYAGQVTFQVKMYSGTEQVVMSCAGTFPVLKGVAPLPNEVPSTSTFDEILEYLQTLTDGSIVSKGILPYDSEFSYPLGASVFDENTRTIYTSLIDDNLGNDLSNATYWGATYISGLTTDDVQGLIDSSMQDFTDELIALQNGKFDKTSVLNARSNSQSQVYSADYANKSFVPMAFAQRFYAKVESSTSATLEDEKPVVSSSNKISVITTNTDFDFTSPMFTLIRTLTNEITLNNTNSFAVDLYFDCSRAVTLGFGAKIKVSSDNGETWDYISSNQSFAEKQYISGLNSEDIVVYTDNVGDETLAIGTLIAIEIFTKQDSSTSLTVDYICGVEIDDANVYSFAEFNFANTNINTNQIEDGAVTYNKLADEVKAKFGEVEVVEVEGSYAEVTDMPYRYEITFTLPNDFDLTSVKEYLFKLTTSISLVNLKRIRIFVQKDFQTINILTPYNSGVSYANENDLAQVFNNSNGWEFKGIMQSNGLLVEMDNLTSVRAEIGNIDTLLTTLNSGGGV